MVWPWLVFFLAAAASAVDGAAVHSSAWAWRLALTLGILWAWPRRRRALAGSAKLALGLGATATALAWARAPHFFAGLEGAFASLCAGALLATLLPQSKRRRAAVLTALAAMATGHAAVACWQHVIAGKTRAAAGFFNPNDLAAFAAPAAIWLATLCWTSKQRGTALVASAASLTCVGGIWAAQSRSGALAVLIGLVLLAAAQKRPGARRRGHKRRPPALHRWLTVGGGVLGAMVTLAGRFCADGADPYAYSRTAIWQAGWAAFRQQPWGYGFGQVGEVFRTRGVAVAGPVRYPAWASHAHAEWLQAGLEAGVVGVVATLGPALFLLVAQRGRGRRGLRALAGLCSLWLPASVGASLHQPPVAAMAVAWAAWIWPPAGRAAPGRLRKRRQPRRKPAAWPTLQLQQGLQAWATGTPAATPTALAALPLAAGLALSLPAALAHAATLQAQTALRHGALEKAQIWASRACLAAPWELAHLLHRADLAVLGEKTDPAKLPDSTAASQERPYLALTTTFGHRFEPWQRLAERRTRVATTPQAWRAAADAWAQAAARHPHAALLWAQAALAAGRAGDRPQARAWAQRALEDEPNCASALFAAAWVARADHAACAGRADCAERADGADRSTCADRTDRRQLARRALAAHALHSRYAGYARAVLHLPPRSIALARAWADADASADVAAIADPAETAVPADSAETAGAAETLPTAESVEPR